MVVEKKRRPQMTQRYRLNAGAFGFGGFMQPTCNRKTIPAQAAIVAGVQYFHG
jgi:hypothetical protein